MIEKPYKYKKEIRITLESDNFPKMQEFAYELLTTKSRGNPEDKENYIAVGGCMWDVEDKNE